MQINVIMAILKASRYIPPETMEKIERLAAVTPESMLLAKLVDCNILDPQTVQNLKEFIQCLQKDFSRGGDKESSIYGLPEEKKKDIVFARQVLNEGICSIDKINEYFQEQANLEKNSDKFYPISQLLVKHQVIPVERFVTFHREIEKKLKAAGMNELLTEDESIRVSVKNGVIQFSETSIPEHFGPYHIMEEIARGGMGVVYKAYDSKLKRHIALKVLKAWENPPLEEIQRFHREARLAARLSHPNIVNIYDAGVVDGVHYFTMDFVEGDTLARHLAKELPNATDALIITREIALALDYAHSQGVIHRDVKPGNIILDASNRPLLTDFGLAKGTNTTDSRHLTKSGAALGTPAYMSPEQAQGSKISKKSDIYSLGSVLYEMLTGRPPFEGTAVGAVISDVISKDPVPPSRINPKIHGDVENICLKAMAKDQNQRYQTAQEMVADIDRFLEGKKPGIARSMSLLRFLAKTIAKHKAACLLVAVILGTSLGVAGWLIFQRIEKLSEARKFYENGSKLLQEKDYQAAIPLLRKAEKHLVFYDKSRKLLASTAQSHAEQAIEILQRYQNEESRNADQYEKGLIRLLQVPAEEQWENLQLLEKLKGLQNQNYRQFLAAVEHLWQAYTCDPANPKVYEGLAQIYDRQLSMVENGDFREIFDWCLNAGRFYRREKNLHGTGSLSIFCEPSDRAEIYLFAIEEHYLKSVFVGWQWNSRSAMTNADTTGEDLASYLEKYCVKMSEPRLDKMSYAGKAPVDSLVVPAGYYLALIKADNYVETRTILHVLRDRQQKVYISLPPSSPSLEDYVHIVMPERKDYCYFLSRFELSWARYSDYLEKQKRPRNKFSLLRKNQPVVGISFREAEEYCNWLSSTAENRQIRYSIPDLEIWQRAAGVEDGRKYPWGKRLEPYLIERVANPPTVDAQMTDVSPYGVHSMAGGVREWCYGRQNKQAVVCGGSFRLQEPLYLEVQYHAAYPTSFSDSDLGFRVMAFIRKN